MSNLVSFSASTMLFGSNKKQKNRKRKLNRHVQEQKCKRWPNKNNLIKLYKTLPSTKSVFKNTRNELENVIQKISQLLEQLSYYCTTIKYKQDGNNGFTLLSEDTKSLAQIVSKEIVEDQKVSIQLKSKGVDRNRSDCRNDLYGEIKKMKSIDEARFQGLVYSMVEHPSSVCGIPWPRLKDEKWRLYTFSKYPQNAAKSAILLAADGFVYLGKGKDSDDSVMCHFCYKVKNRWLPFDDIPEVHQQLSPDCSMVTQINCSNISLKTNLDSSLFDQHLNPKQSRNRADDNRNNEIETGAAVENYKNPGENIEQDGTSLPRERYNNNYTQITNSSEQSTLTRETQAVTALQSEISEASPRVATTSSANSNSNSSPSPHITSATASNTSTTVSTSQTSIATGPSLPAASTSDPPEVVTQTVSAAGRNSAKGNAGGPTYSDLGIVTERPKRFEYAVLTKRMETFLSWPRDHRLRPEDLVEAGFYYAGYGDCARCFYCGGGLRNWEDEDDVWVEHARWFPKCAYIRQQMGQVFVDTIQDMNKSFDHISMKMVVDKIGGAASAFQLAEADESAWPNYQDKQSQSRAERNCKTQIPLNYVLMGLVPFKDLDNSLFSSWRSRKISFRKTGFKSSAGLLARAGLYYDDSTVTIKCFSCGGVMHYFPDKDNIFIYHAKTFPGCCYIKLIKDLFTSFQTLPNIQVDIGARQQDVTSLLQKEKTSTSYACQSSHAFNSAKSQVFLDDSGNQFHALIALGKRAFVQICPSK